MNRDKINELYAGQIFSQETQLAARDRIHWICKQAQGEKVLDIGCSQGIVCLILGREGFSCTGVDIEQEAIDFARRELEKEEDITKRRIVFQVADATNLKFGDNTFDTVILGEIIEHLTHPEKVLQEAKRVLKEGGRIVITTPLGLNSHFDHKQTYFPLSFLETVRPFFNTLSLDILHSYIVYSGVKEASYDHSQIPDKDLFYELINLEKKVEERCVAKERHFEQVSRSLIEKGKEYQEQVNSLIQERDAIRAKSAALQEDTRKRFAVLQEDMQKQIDALQKDKREQVTALQAKCVSLENDLLKETASKYDALAYQELIFRRAMRWRLGSVVVGGLRIVYDFFTHPIRFSKEAGKRFREYYREIMALPVEKVEQVPEEKKTENNVVTIIPPLGTYDQASIDLNETDNDTVSFACVLDEFTRDCLKPEVNLITFRPDNWKEILQRAKPNAVFIESAWHGNGGSWQYKVAKYQKNMGEELRDVVDWAKKEGIPSIFWNKEDPPHYERFIDKAKLFDYVFTSDENCIPDYRKDLGHQQVFALPFAAQPKIHNPILHHPREHNVCFAGTYYGAIYPERQRDMDLLLKPALEYGLHIYDRQHGMVGPGLEHYRFPELYKDAIKGRLDYAEMVQAYKNFRVFLNVNSVKTSPTMFSRRVYELMASGTVVISTYSKGIEELLGNDLVLFSDTEESTKRHLENLLTNDDYWSRLSVKGIRKVMEEHTYHHRLNYVLQQCGLGVLPDNLPFFTVFSIIDNPQKLENLRHVLGKQTYRNFDVVLLFEGQSDDNQVSDKTSLLDQFNQQGLITGFRNGLIGLDVYCIESYDAMEDLSKGDYLFVFEPDDYYGENYLKDYALAALYSDQCNHLGKHTFYKAVENGEKVENPGFEYMCTHKVPTSTLAIRKEKLNPSKLRSILQDVWFILPEREGSILSLDRFNYLQRLPNQAINTDFSSPVNL